MLIVYLVAISYVWSRGSIFKRVREWQPLRPLLNCPLCSAWWIGFLGYAAWIHWPAAVEAIGRASLVAALAFAWYCTVRRL